jgi:hypothetical protein
MVKESKVWVLIILVITSPFCHSCRLKPICFIQDFQQTLIYLLCYDNITCKVFTNFNMSLKIVKVARVFEIVAFNTTWSNLKFGSPFDLNFDFIIQLFYHFFIFQLFLLLMGQILFCGFNLVPRSYFVLFLFLFKMNLFGWYLLSFGQFIWPTWAIWIITKTWFNGHGLWLIHFPFALEFVEFFFHTLSWFGRWTLCSLPHTHVFSFISF